MTVPMAFGDLGPNWILGETLREFVALGIDFGFFGLEQLAYDSDAPSQIVAAVNQTRVPALQQLAEELDLTSWTDIAGRLKALSQRFGPTLTLPALDD